MHRQIGAQDVRQHDGVAGVRLAARLGGPLPIACHGSRVDRVDGEAGGLERGHDEVLVGLDRHRHRLRFVGVFSDHGHQSREPRQPGVDPTLGDRRPDVVDKGDVMMDLGPVDPARDFQGAVSFLLLMDEPESPRSDLMDSVRDATPHQLAADPATGRATVYIETSKVGQIRSGHLPAARSTPLLIPAHGSVMSEWAPASGSTCDPLTLPLGDVADVAPIDLGARAK
jgi:hypothetical protein